MRAIVSLLALLGAGLALTGCGGGDTPGVSQGTDLANGRQKFISAGCGGCHVFEAAGSNGAVGPNLDTAFQPSRDQGFEESTFEQVVRAQIAYPGLDSVMPPDLVTGKDADDVSYFVAQCAGPAQEDPQCAPPPAAPAGGGGETGGADTGAGGGGEAADGADVFAQAGCGSCHTLAAAGSTGAVGPNLDDLQPSREAVIAIVTDGRGAMPAFGDQLSQAQIEAVADYVSQSAGQGG